VQLVSWWPASDYVESFAQSVATDLAHAAPHSDRMSKSILSVSNDAMLLTTRRMLLEGEGYCVVSALGLEQAAAQCKTGNFDLLLLGHTIPNADQRKLINIFHEHCPAPVLVLRRPGDSAPPEAEYHSLADSPQNLIALVKQILSGPANRARARPKSRL